jgi:hypothetical protein
MFNNKNPPNAPSGVRFTPTKKFGTKYKGKKKIKTQHL